MPTLLSKRPPGRLGGVKGQKSKCLPFTATDTATLEARGSTPACVARRSQCVALLELLAPCQEHSLAPQEHTDTARGTATATEAVTVGT